MARGIRQAPSRSISSRTARAASDGPVLRQASSPGPLKEMLNYEMVTTHRELLGMVRRYRNVESIALDIETASNGGFGSWRGAIRLIQIGVDDDIHGREQAVVDCFAVDPRPLMKLLTDEREKVIHSSAFEKEWFAYHHDVWLPNVYDTCTAWQAIHSERRKRDESYGRQLANLKVVTEQVFGVDISKDDQASDWGATHLSASQLDYAAMDVALLGPLAERTKEAAAQLQLEDKVDKSAAAVDGRIEKVLAKRLAIDGRQDENHTLMRAMEHVRSRAELDRIWKAGRQVALHHQSRVSARQFYEAKLAELAAARAAVAA